MATKAEEDEDYQYIIRSIKSKIKTSEIKDDSELKRMEGDSQFLSVTQMPKGEIVVRNEKEILIPKDLKKTLKMEMHQGHLSGI